MYNFVTNKSFNFNNSVWHNTNIYIIFPVNVLYQFYSDIELAVEGGDSSSGSDDVSLFLSTQSRVVSLEFMFLFNEFNFKSIKIPNKHLFLDEPIKYHYKSFNENKIIKHLFHSLTNWLKVSSKNVDRMVTLGSLWHELLDNNFSDDLYPPHDCRWCSCAVQWVQ